MKSICLIIPYYGKFPNYFDLWLESVRYNPTIDFLIVSDIEEQYNYPQNVKIKKMTFAELQERIRSLFPFKAAIDSPYKLCDYKVAYGEIFYEETKNYDFWGYCDIDLIFGDIRKYITDDMLQKYDKIGMLGHFSIYRNCDEIRSLYKSKCAHIIDYQTAYSNNWIWHFDEYPGLSYICEELKINYCDIEDYADLDWCKQKFIKTYDHSSKERDKDDIQQIFYWNDGRVYNLIKENHEIMTKELMYEKKKKRKMVNDIDDLSKGYYIVPNKFLKIEEDKVSDIIDRYSQDGWSQAYKEFKRECFINRFKFNYWRYKITMMGKKK